MNMKRLLSKITAVVSAVTLLCFVSDFSSTDTTAADASQDKLDSLTKTMEILINEARSELGLQPVYVVPYLCEVSALRAKETSFKFSHYRPSQAEIDAGVSDPNDNTLKFSTAIDLDIAPYFYCAENIAGGNATAEATFNQWKNSPSHWAAIMNPEYTHIGVAVSYDQNSAYKYYWEQFFVATDKKLDNQTIPERYKTVPKSSGDIDGDADINAFDLITINQYLADDTAFLNDLQVSSADMLKDGVITSADAMVLRKYLLGEYKTLPVTLDMLIGS